MEGRARVVDRHATIQPFAAVQGDGPQVTLIEMLVNLEQVSLVIQPGREGALQGGQLVTGNDDHRPVYLGYQADCGLVGFSGPVKRIWHSESRKNATLNGYYRDHPGRLAIIQ